jgi:hypothetical protein
VLERLSKETAVTPLWGKPTQKTVGSLIRYLSLAAQKNLLHVHSFLLEWSSYDRIWFHGPYKQEICILIGRNLPQYIMDISSFLKALKKYIMFR